MLFFETNKAKEDSMKSGVVYSLAIFLIVKLARGWMDFYFYFCCPILYS